MAFRARAVWQRRPKEWRVLLALLVLAGAIWIFAGLADEVLEGETRKFDQAVLLAMRTPGDLSDPIGPGWMEEMGRDFTALGSIAVLVFILLSTAGFLVLQRKHAAAIWLIIAVGSGMLLSSLLKWSFDRPRPDLVPHGATVYSASFPSGHSLMAAVVYLTLGTLLARVQPLRRLKFYILGVAILLTLLIGVSRIYLGVHWPTDVLAGWTVGAAWALLFWLVTWYLQRHGRIEGDG